MERHGFSLGRFLFKFQRYIFFDYQRWVQRWRGFTEKLVASRFCFIIIFITLPENLLPVDSVKTVINCIFKCLFNPSIPLNPVLCWILIGLTEHWITVVLKPLFILFFRKNVWLTVNYVTDLCLRFRIRWFQDLFVPRFMLLFKQWHF